MPADRYRRMRRAGAPIDLAGPAASRPVLTTYTGRRFDLLDPQPEQVCLADVAHALAFTCRYGGHTRRYYSVAEHSVLLSEWMGWGCGAPVECLRVALLHDAEEAYVRDIIAPQLAVGLPGGKAAVVQTQGLLVRSVVFGALGLDTSLARYEPRVPELALGDAAIRVDEMAELFPAGPHWGLEGKLPLGVRLRCWGPEDAEREFLRRAEELGIAA